MPNGKKSQRGQQAQEGQPAENGGPNDVVADVFHQVSELCGLLIVAFVAPVAPASGSGSAAGIDAAMKALRAEAEARKREAKARNKEELSNIAQRRGAKRDK